MTLPSPRPKRRRRAIRIRRQDVDDYIERASVKPGELRHLNPPVEGRYRVCEVHASPAPEPGVGSSPDNRKVAPRTVGTRPGGVADLKEVDVGNPTRNVLLARG